MAVLLLALSWLCSLAAAGPYDPATPQRRREFATTSRHAYTIRVGGTADMENTLSREHCNIKIAFQNNVSLVIANTGTTVVHNPKLLINGRGDWGTIDRMIAEWTRGARDDQERALLLWQHMRENRYHSMPLYADREFHDPVRLFNIYGLALCDDDGYAGCTLFGRAGLGKPKYPQNSQVRSLNGHVQCEAALDNGLQFLDVDQDCFYLDRENERPISGDACEKDHDLVRREMNYGPTVNEKSWRASESVASLFGADDGLHEYSELGHEMTYDLRPGEMVIFRWDNLGKFAAQSAEWAAKPAFFGNSKFVYRPQFDADSLSLGALETKDIEPFRVDDRAPDGSSVLTTWASATGPDSYLVYRVKVPYTICGGRVVCAGSLATPQDGLAVDFSLDGRTWREVADERAAPPVSDGDKRLRPLLETPLDGLLDVQNNPPKRQYFIRVRLAARSGRDGTRLTGLRLETDVMAAPMALPRLVLGDNSVVYADETAEPHQVMLVHDWLESSSVSAPAPPAAPEYPLPNATVRDAMLTYKWPAAAGANAYHLQVSKTPDLKLIYRPSLDVIIPTNQWVVPFTGIYSPDTDYYWRVRVREANGLWGAWSPIWRFRWDGPRVPVNVRVENGVLRWEPHPRGPRPASYEVYGSDEKGFLCSKTPYDSYGRGKVAGNFVCATTATELRVIDPAATNENLNRCFYRVVALDVHGTPSGSSAYAELLHPHIYSLPAATATANQPYQYPLRLIKSLGDCQHLGNPAKQRFHDIEQYTFKLTGPQWLTVDEQGVISGTPPAAGEFAVKVEATNQFRKSAVQEYTLVVRQ